MPIDQFIFYRPGEVELFLRPDMQRDVPSAAHRLTDDGLEALRGVILNGTGIKLHQAPMPHPPVRLPRKGWDRAPNWHEPVADLNTLRLDSWRGDTDRESKDIDAIRRAVLEVKQVVDFLNSEIRKGGESIALDRHFLLAASPNWLCSAQSDCPCPAGRPVPSGVVKRFKRDEVDAEVRAALARINRTVQGEAKRGAGVRIAVFDAWPMYGPGVPNRELGRIEDRYDALYSPGKDLSGLEDAKNGTLVKSTHIYDKLPAAWPDTYATRVDCNQHSDGPYELADHGLFCIYIAREIAPDASDTHVYRCLSDEGVDDLHFLALAVQEAIDGAANDGVPLVLNLSLGFGPHPAVLDRLLGTRNTGAGPQENVGLHFDDPQLFRTDAAALMRPAKTNVELDQLDATRRPEMWPIVHLFSLAGDPRVLAVAAAGNDSCGESERAGPRFPANVEGVIGVSAIDARLALTDYSNLDDLAGTPDDGVGAYGGDVAGSPPVTVPDTGLIGPYSDDHVPNYGGGDNDSGWAEWSGTSFATPIIAGLAASVWSEGTALSAQEVLSAICQVPTNYIPLRQS